LEGGDSCVAFSSGMAAIACLFELFAPGDRIVTSWDLYGGTIRLFDAVSRKNGYTIDSVDTSDLDRHVEPRSRRRRRLRCSSRPRPTPRWPCPTSPPSPKRPTTPAPSFAVDNTFLTPYFQKPP
jgi:cystathionine beta-lyase/cystathionine gamma-synthase